MTTRDMQITRLFLFVFIFNAVAFDFVKAAPSRCILSEICVRIVSSLARRPQGYKVEIPRHTHRPHVSKPVSEETEMRYLSGGRLNTILKLGDTVHRPSGSWTPQVHELLKHIRKEGFFAAPIPLGFDESGNEIVSFIEGEVSNYPLSVTAASPEALISAARLLRKYHDASGNFLATHFTDSACWQLSCRSPQEVICHGDFAPYNVVLGGKQGKEAIGIIDFDTCHPGPRIWDVSYALYRWAPFKNPDNRDGFGNIDEQIKRGFLFCEAYGFPQNRRSQLPDIIVERLQALIDFMRAEAEKGNETFQSNMEQGHHLRYLNDIEYIAQHRHKIEAGLIIRRKKNA